MVRARVETLGMAQKGRIKSTWKLYSWDEIATTEMENEEEGDSWHQVKAG